MKTRENKERGPCVRVAQDVPGRRDPSFIEVIVALWIPLTKEDRKDAGVISAAEYQEII